MYVVSANSVSFAKNRCTFLRLANFLVFFAAACPLMLAQVEVKADNPIFAKLISRFKVELAERGKRPLSCRVETLQPRLGYSFRFYSGFYASFPARQFDRGNGNRLATFFRVTSETSGEEHFFYQPMNVPPIPDDPGRTQLEAGGGFYVGDGRYRVDWLLIDHKERSCIRSWTIRTPRTKFDLRMPAGAVQPLGLEAWKGFSEKKNAADGRITVFLSAMPLYRRRMLSKLPPYDLALLLSSLMTLLDSTKYSHARVVAFDLMSKRILFEQDEFDPAGYERLRDKLETASYGTIDYHALARGITDRRLFEQMLKTETAREKKSDAVVFLGAEGSPSDRLPPVFAEYRQGLSSLYYVFFARFPQPVQDIMYQFVHSGKGKVVNLFRPPDLVNAIRAIDSAN